MPPGIANPTAFSAWPRLSTYLGPYPVQHPRRQNAGSARPRGRLKARKPGARNTTTPRARVPENTPPGAFRRPPIPAVAGHPNERPMRSAARSITAASPSHKAANAPATTKAATHKARVARSDTSLWPTLCTNSATPSTVNRTCVPISNRRSAYGAADGLGQAYTVSLQQACHDKLTHRSGQR